MTKHEEFIRFFREIQPKFSRYYSSILSDVDLTLPQFTLLGELVQAGRVSMSEIGSRLHISKPAVTSLVDRLEKNKFLIRVEHPKDRRIYLLDVQPKGRKTVFDIQARALRLLLKAYELFKSPEQKIIRDFYSVISEKLDEYLNGREIGKS